MLSELTRPCPSAERAQPATVDRWPAGFMGPPLAYGTVSRTPPAPSFKNRALKLWRLLGSGGSCGIFPLHTLAPEVTKGSSRAAYVPLGRSGGTSLRSKPDACAIPRSPPQCASLGTQAKRMRMLLAPHRTSARSRLCTRQVRYRDRNNSAIATDWCASGFPRERRCFLRARCRIGSPSVPGGLRCHGGG